jgi:hypothetical protein
LLGVLHHKRLGRKLTSSINQMNVQQVKSLNNYSLNILIEDVIVALAMCGQSAMAFKVIQVIVDK